MPLTAYLYSQKIFAPLLNDNEWWHIKSSLKKNPEYLHFKCCQSPVYARVSKNGVKHFVHKNTDHCNYVHESEDHLLLKMEVYKTCQKLGWEAEIEFAGDNFKADVLAQKNGQRVAFEIQLSRQDLRSTIQRQKALHKAGVRGAWLFKHLPKGFRPIRFLPAFELIIDNKDAFPFRCNITNRKIPVKKCIELLLRGKIKFRKKLVLRKQQRARIYLFDENCWRCGFNYKTVGAWSILKSRCGLEIENAGFEIESLAIETKRIIDELRGSYMNITVFKKSFSRTTGTYYWANNCPQCKAIFGQHFLNNRILELMYNGPTPEKVITYKIDDINRFQPIECPHWCFVGPEGFCHD